MGDNERNKQCLFVLFMQNSEENKHYIWYTDWYTATYLYKQINQLCNSTYITHADK